MGEDVGSMEIKGIFRDAGLMISLAKVKNDLTGIAHQAKSVTTDFTRLTAQSKKLQGVLGLIGGFSFFGLLASAPRTAAQLERIWLYVKLIFNVIDKHLAPAVKWLADQFENLYKWFKNLDPEWQKIISYGLGAGAALTALGVGAGLSAAGLSGIASSITAIKLAVGGKSMLALLGMIGLTAAIAYITIKFAEWAAEVTGLNDWMKSLNTTFLKARDSGEMWAVVIDLALVPIRTLMGILDGLVNSDNWKKLRDDFKLLKQDIDSITAAYEKFIRSVGLTPSSSQIGIRSEASEASTPAGGYAPGATIYAGSTVGGNTNTSNNKETTINNEISGNTFVMQNGMDVNEFVDSINKQQARSANWRNF